MIFFWVLFIITVGILGRLSGNGFGQKWGVSWLPEALHSLPYGLTLGWAANELGAGFLTSMTLASVGSIISYAGMQSATWMFLRWESHDDPNTERTSTLRPIIDWLASRWGYKIGDEGYAWVAAAVKGFIITLPVGGLGAITWPLGYEIGSHAKGQVGDLDPHVFSEFFASALTAVWLVLIISMVGAYE